MIPGGLDFITSLLDNGGTLEHGGVKYSVSNTIFILISDVGMDRMIKILLSSPSRAEIPLQDLRNEVKEALDAQWTNMGLGKFVSEVVPFLPLNKMGLEQVTSGILSQPMHLIAYSYLFVFIYSIIHERFSTRSFSAIFISWSLQISFGQKIW